jgi:hypothetical protein
MKPGRLLAPLAVLVATAAPALATEQLPCTRFEQLAGFLAQTYGEKPVSTGLQADGQILQIFSSQERGSWTAVTTNAAGKSCVVATGRHWEQDEARTDEVYRPATLSLN